VAQLVEALRPKMGRSGFDSQRGPWKFSSDLFLLSISLGSIQPLTQTSAKELS
jgi:hypothetical protein